MSALEKRDLARDGEERGDAHHHPAEAATDADLRERDLREQLRWRSARRACGPPSPRSRTGPTGSAWTAAREIPEGRLRALPDAVRCVPCQRVASRLR